MLQVYLKTTQKSPTELIFEQLLKRSTGCLSVKHFFTIDFRFLSKNRIIPYNLSSESTHQELSEHYPQIPLKISTRYLKPLPDFSELLKFNMRFLEDNRWLFKCLKRERIDFFAEETNVWRKNETNDMPGSLICPTTLQIKSLQARLEDTRYPSQISRNVIV